MAIRELYGHGTLASPILNFERATPAVVYADFAGSADFSFISDQCISEPL